MSAFRSTALPFAVAILAVMSSLWTATQWAAAMLGYQAALGPAWIEVLGCKVYAPWQLFVWWFAFDAQAPDVFPRAGVVAAHALDPIRGDFNEDLIADGPDVLGNRVRSQMHLEDAGTGST